MGTEAGGSVFVFIVTDAPSLVRKFDESTPGICEGRVGVVEIHLATRERV